MCNECEALKVALKETEKEVERLNALVDEMFEDYEARILALTEECGRLKM